MHLGLKWDIVRSFLHTHWCRCDQNVCRRFAGWTSEAGLIFLLPIRPMPATALTARGPDSTSAEPQISLIWVSMSSSTKPPRLPSAPPLSAAPAEAPEPAGSGSVGKNMTDGQLFSRFSCVSSLSSGGRCRRVDSRAHLQWTECHLWACSHVHVFVTEQGSRKLRPGFI